MKSVNAHALLPLCIALWSALVQADDPVQPASNVVIDVFREAARAADPATLPVVSGMPATSDQTSIYGEVLTTQSGDRWEEVEAHPDDYGESVLAEWIRDARSEARDRGVRSLTLKQRRNLSHYFDGELLGEVRYRFDPGMELNTFASDIRYGDEGVTVLGDTVVFRLRRDSEDNLLMWAHALGHMQLFQELDFEGYARRQLRDYPALEAEVEATVTAYRRAVDEAGESDIFELSYLPHKPPFVNQCTLYDLELLVASNGDIYPHGQAVAPGVLPECDFDIIGEFSRYCVRPGGAVVRPAGDAWHQVGSCSALP